MCVLSFINCKIRPKNQVSLPVCAMVNSADTNDKSQIAISRKKPRFYSQLQLYSFNNYHLPFFKT